MEKQGFRENRLYNQIYLNILTGVAVSLVLLFTGIILLATNGAELTGEAIHLGQLLLQIGKLDPLAIITFGILVLLITPFSGVILILIASFLEKDKGYIAALLAVLIVLALSLALALS